MSLLLSLLSVTASCTPAAAPAADNAAIVRKFFAAVNANDDAAIGALLKPGAGYYSEADDMDLPLAELLTLLTAQKKGGQLKLVDLAPGDQNEVEFVTQAEGGPKKVGMVLLEGGCITDMEVH